MIPHKSEKPHAREPKKQKSRLSIMVMLAGFYALISVLILVSVWPALFHDAISYIFYPQKIDEPAIKSVMVPPLEDTKLKGSIENLSSLHVLLSVTKDPPIKDVHAVEVSSVSSGFAKEFSAHKNVQQKTNVPSSSSKIAKNGKYAIQIIAYPEARIKDAIAFAHDLRKTQSDVYLERVNIRKQGVWYRILMGHFKNGEDATRYMKEKKILEAYPGSFVQVKAEG